MEFIVKFEIAKGKYEDKKNNKQVEYQNLKLFTLTFNENSPTWKTEEKDDVDYEQVICSGGVRERSLIWIPHTDFDYKNKEGEDAVRTGIRIPRFFNAYKLRPVEVENIFGCKINEFEKEFIKNIFLHRIKVIKMTNEYGRDEITDVQVSKETILELIS